MRPKSEIYTPKRDDEHTRPFHMRVPTRGVRTIETDDHIFAGSALFVVLEVHNDGCISDACGDIIT